jgi:hypothetical protein
MKLSKNMKYYWEHKHERLERQRTYGKQYYLKHKERLHDSNLTYYQTNKDKVLIGDNI